MSTSSANPITQRVSQKMKKKAQTAAKDDPTEGDGRRWATGAKFHFLTQRLPRWQDAREVSEMSTFYSRITLLFIRHFSWERALDIESNGPVGEPSEENLDQVLEVTGLAEEEISRRNVTYLDLRGKLQRWFRYHGTKSLKLRKPDNSLAKIIKAFGTHAKAPRRMQTLQFYSKLYYEARVKSVVDAEWPKVVAQAGAKGLKPPKRLKHQNAVVARIFETETPEFQAALKAQRDAEHEEEVAAWKASRLDFGEAPRSAEQFNEALVEASHWLPGFSEALSKHLGLNVSVLLTGPIGSKGGRIDVKATHAGKTQGITPSIWPDYDPQSYKGLIKALLAFGKASFSDEECRRRALPNSTSQEDPELAEGSSRASSPSPDPPERPLPPVLAAVLASTQRGKQPAGTHAKPAGSTSIPGMPPPARMSSGRRSGNDSSALPSSGASAAEEFAGGKVHAPPLTIPTPTPAPTPTTALPPLPALSASSVTTSTSHEAPTSTSSTSSSSSSLIVLPPPPATSQASSQPAKPSATSRPQPRPQRKVVDPDVTSVNSPVVPHLPPSSTSSSATTPLSRGATSPPPTTPELSGSSLGPSSLDVSSPCPSSSGADVDMATHQTSQQPGPFSRVDAANCTPDIERVVEYLMKYDAWGPTWEHCVATFIEIERFAQFKPRGSLVSPTDGRPREVTAWMKRARKLVDFPITNVDEFADAWMGWWRNNQPGADVVKLSSQAD